MRKKTILNLNKREARESPASLEATKISSMAVSLNFSALKLYIYTYILIHIHIYILWYPSSEIYLKAFVAHIHIHIHVHIHTHTHTHTHTYTYTHIHTQPNQYKKKPKIWDTLVAFSQNPKKNRTPGGPDQNPQKKNKPKKELGPQGGEPKAVLSRVGLYLGVLVGDPPMGS